MSDFDFYKDKEIKEKKSITFRRLNRVYNKIPATKGCMENINKEGGCNAWCCRLMTPQVLYSEFLNAWQHTISNFSLAEIIEVIEKAIRNYVAGNVIKGCIYFDTENNLCSIHERRPYNCRVYGITPKEEFKKRFEDTKKQFEDVPDADIREQCNLISTLSGKKVKTQDTDRWWRSLNKIEKTMGIPQEKINDDIGGSYRTYHDHVLLEIMPQDVLLELQKVRLMEDQEEKVLAVQAFMKEFKERIYGTGETQKSEDT
jgi:Fe-S-cluster containining protein